MKTIQFFTLVNNPIMVNLKNMYKLIPILLLLVFTGCKKKDADASPDSDTNQIAASELLDYYLVAQHKTGGNKLLVLYFTKEGNVINANAHLQGYARIKEVTIQNSVFSIDYNGDGNSVYNFTLEKDAEGKLKLKSYDFKYNGAGNQLNYALMAKKTDAFAFANLSFKAGNTTFKLSTEAGIGIINFQGDANPYYKLTNIGFKTNNDKFLGVTVPNWSGITTPTLLLEKDDVLYIASEYDGEEPAPACNLILPGVTFKSKSTEITNDQKAVLAAVAQTLRENSSCKIVVTGFCNGPLEDRKISWTRVNNVIQYLTGIQRIESSRFIFKYAQPGGDCNEVYLTNATQGQTGGGVIPPYPIQ